MPGEVMLNRLRTVLDSIQYPVPKDAAGEELSDVTLLYADGEEPLASVGERSNVDTFADSGDLETEIYNNLPIEAVGEPGQSEGDG
ncbi:MAG: hypothetical protein V5A62_06325 [Haloarculaceae archaeon]